MKRRASRVLVLLAMGATTTGCAAWMSTTSEVGLSSAPDATFAQTADVALGIGSSGGRVYMQLGGGISYRVGNESPDADLHVEVGYENGKAVRWGVGLVGGGRLGPGYWMPTADPTVLEYADQDVGGGVAGHLFVRVPPESPSATGLYFGVAGATELVAQGPEGNERIRFKGTIGPALRYVFDDTTEPAFKL